MRRQCVVTLRGWWDCHGVCIIGISETKMTHDKLTSQKPEGGTYFRKKKCQNGIFFQKKHAFPHPPPPFSAGFSPTSFGGQLKCRFWTCQLGQKLQGSCFTWWVPLSRSLLRGWLRGISTSILPSCVGLILDEGIIFSHTRLYQEINLGMFVDSSGIIPTYQGIIS